MRRVRDVDPDAHRGDSTQTSLRAISSCYGYEAARSVLRGRRPRELLPGGRALGVTQPAVSLQVRALEKRLGAQLLDRSGRRVEPTEAGSGSTAARSGCSRSRSSCSRRSRRRGGRAHGPLEIGARRARRRWSCLCSLCEFQQGNPGVVDLAPVTTRSTWSTLVAERELELGVVGAARATAAVELRAVLPRRGRARCPPRHRSAGETIGLDELREEPLILMQEGAGVRQMVEDELREAGPASPRPRGAARAGAAGVRQGGGAGGPRSDVHLAARRSRPSSPPGASPRRASRGSTCSGEISLVRAAGRDAEPGGRGVHCLREGAVGVIVRWGLDELRACSASSGSSGRSWSRARAGTGWGSPPRRAGPRCRRTGSRCREGVDGDPRRRRRQRDRHGEGGLGGERAADGLGADDVLGGRVDDVVRRPRSRTKRMVGGGSGAHLAGIVYEPELTLDLPKAPTGGTAMNALAHCAEALYPGRTSSRPRRRQARADRRVAAARGRRRSTTSARGRPARRRCPRRRGAGPHGLCLSATRWRRRSAAATDFPTAR